jgi:hypothetical protein
MNHSFMGFLILIAIVIVVVGWLILMAPTARMNARKTFGRGKPKYLPRVSGEGAKMSKVKNPYSF